MSQFSFDEKSSNFLSKKENTENNIKDNDKNANEILIKEDIVENKNNLDDNNKNEENNEIKYINKITNEENEKNDDSNFDYELPLGSDDNPEFFYVCENTEENKKKINNEKKNEPVFADVPPPEIKNDEILTPKKQKRKKWNEKIQSAKINFDENKLLKIKENEKKENITKFNSSNKKSNKILKYSSLIEENNKSNDYNNYFSEQNNNIINSNTYHNSFKNTNFTSKDNNLKKELINKINNDKISINTST